MKYIKIQFFFLLQSLDDMAAKDNNGYTLLYSDDKHEEQEANSKTKLLRSANSPNGGMYGAVETDGLTASLRQNGLPMNRPRTPLSDEIAIKVSFNGPFS